MNIVIMWLILWFVVMGLPNLLFKKYKVTYYQNSWQHTLFYIFSILILLVVYKTPFSAYFNNFSTYSLFVTLYLFILWLVVPITYKNDYHPTKNERFRYQLPKFFEIMFQQLCFLGGLLTFGISPVAFGLVFFAVHIPVIFIIAKNFALFFTFGSLIGGLIFANLQFLGIEGFLLSLIFHLLFYIVFHYSLSRKHFLGITPHRR